MSLSDKVRLSPSGRPDFLNLPKEEMLVCKYSRNHMALCIPCSTLLDAQKLYDGLLEEGVVREIWWHVVENDDSLIVGVEY